MQLAAAGHAGLGVGRPVALEKLRAQLNRLVAEEAYEEAAKVRDLISQMVRQT